MGGCSIVGGLRALYMLKITMIKAGEVSHSQYGEPRVGYCSVKYMSTESTYVVNYSSIKMGQQLLSKKKIIRISARKHM